MNIQWYPGHMTKARRAIEESIKIIDLVIEIVDARLPLSSKNPDIDKIAQKKARIIILGKADLADPAVTRCWEKYFASKGFYVLTLDSRKNTQTGKIDEAIAKAMEKKTERDRKRGIMNRSVKVLVAGIPNVGKSTFINSLVKKSVTKTGDRPGVTKGNQWIQLKKGVDLLDTPGILWPKIDDEASGIRLALIGSVNDMILDVRELSVNGIDYIKESYPGALNTKYGVAEDADGYEILTEIARVRNLLKKGSEPDIDRASVMFLDDLRGGRIGLFSYERPEVDDAAKA